MYVVTINKQTQDCMGIGVGYLIGTNPPPDFEDGVPLTEMEEVLLDLGYKPLEVSKKYNVSNMHDKNYSEDEYGRYWNGPHRYTKE